MADAWAFGDQQESLLGLPPKPRTSIVDRPLALRQTSSSKCHLISWILQAILFFASLVLFYRSSYISDSQHQRCVDKHAVWSPAISVINDKYQTRQFNGTFDNHSPYKGPPSPQVDAIWEDMTDVGIMSVTDEDMDKIGHSKDSVRLPPESGGGFMGSLEVNHQLHCVYILWQATHQDYYLKKGAPPWVDSAPTRQKHLDHCVDMLRQKLMCDADVGVFNYNWVKGRSRPYPNFNTMHKCRNFDDVLTWAKSHQAKAPAGGIIPKPSDAVELDVPP